LSLLELRFVQCDALPWRSDRLRFSMVELAVDIVGCEPVSERHFDAVRQSPKFADGDTWV